MVRELGNVLSQGRCGDLCCGCIIGGVKIEKKNGKIVKNDLGNQMWVTNVRFYLRRKLTIYILHLTVVNLICKT